MPLVEAGNTAVALAAYRRFRQAIHETADEMAQGMATEGIAAEEEHVEAQDDRSQADTEACFTGSSIGKPHAPVGIVGQEEEKADRDVEKVAMDVLDDQRQGVLSEIAFPRFADRARWRVRPEGLVLRAPVVVAGQSKTNWDTKNKKRR